MRTVNVIETTISPREPTHIVSYWQNGHRAIVAVEATTDAEAIERAIELAGECDQPFAQDPYQVAALGPEPVTACPHCQNTKLDTQPSGQKCCLSCYWQE